MNANDLFVDVFNKTKELLKPCVVDEENSQASHILYYLSLFACYLIGKEEAEIFKSYWLEIRADLKSISDFEDFLNQSYMLEAHIEQSIKEESVHKPGSSENIGIFHFYEEKFPQLYEDAKKAKEDFWTNFDSSVKATQNYVQRLIEDDDFFEREARNNPNVWLMLD